MGQSITITNINDTKGIIPTRISDAKVITKYSRLLHIINLDRYQTNIDRIIRNIDHVNALINKEANVIFKLKIKTIHQRLNKLKETYEHLQPITRKKRGLINGLGNVINSITGNLDQTDLEHLEKAIEQINRNEDKLTDKLNQQIHVNNMMTDRFAKIQKYVTEQARIIEFDTKLLANSTETVTKLFKIDQHLHQILFNIETLQNHFDDIIDSITFAKLKIISKHILDKNEIDIIKNITLKQGILIETEEDLYNLLWLQAYINHTQLIFSIQIPEYNPLNFTCYELTQTLINNSYTIPVPNPKIITNSKFYQYINKPCITTKNFISCETENIMPVVNTCVPAIINNIPAQCNLTKGTTGELAQEIDNGLIYVFTKQQTPFSSTCNQHQKGIIGQNIIKFHNCTIQIMNKTFTSKPQQTYEEKSLQLPYNDIIPGKIKIPINPEELEIITFQHVQQIEHLSHFNKAQKVHTTIFYSIIAILCILILCYVFLRVKNQIFKRKPAPATSDNGPKISFWPFLRGEELRHDTNNMTSPTSVVPLTPISSSQQT